MGNAQCQNICSKKTEAHPEGELVCKADFHVHHPIGRGGFGKVLKVEKDGEVYAMKEMLKARVMAKKSVDSVKRELQLMQKILSDFIVNVHWAFVDENYLYLVMDLMEGGDLRFHHLHVRKFPPECTQFFIACLVQALEAVHEKGIIHRDIKPENLVFDANGYLRLTDFGIAHEWTPENKSENSGTPGYMAPEVMFKQNHGIAADYFAVGVIAYECIMGRRPYLGRNRREIREAILNKQAGIRERDLPAGYTREAADFVNKCLKRQPAQRLGMQGALEVKQHPFFKNFDWDALQKKTLKPTFIPDTKKQNFDNNHVNHRGWNDTEEVDEQRQILGRASQKCVFDSYYFDKGQFLQRIPTSMKNEDPSDEEDDDGNYECAEDESSNTDFNESQMKVGKRPDQSTIDQTASLMQSSNFK